MPDLASLFISAHKLLLLLLHGHTGLQRMLEGVQFDKGTCSTAHGQELTAELLHLLLAPGHLCSRYAA